MRILKTDNGHQTATFVILQPDVEDRNGQAISSDEIIKTAHEFMMNLPSKSVNVNHKNNTDIEEAKFVESYVLPVDMEIADETIIAGSWLVAIKFPNDLWQQVLDGDIVGVSMEGSGYVD